MLNYIRISIFLLCFFIFNSCSKKEENSPSFPLSTSQNYFKSVSSVVMEVYYEPGAEPFVGNFQIDGTPVWSVTSENLIDIFSYRSSPPSLSVPTSLDQMEEMVSFSKATWTADDVLQLNSQYKQLSPSSSQAVFYVYFLNGNASSGNSTIGFNINGTPVIAIFKDVIEQSGGLVAVQRFVEQSTIVHEMGHALGFVNAGVPMVQDHQDEEHGAHSDDSDCVMYWLNEGVEDLKDFIGPFVQSGEKGLWGPRVLSDAQAFSE